MDGKLRTVASAAAFLAVVGWLWYRRRKDKSTIKNLEATVNCVRSAAASPEKTVQSEHTISVEARAAATRLWEALDGPRVRSLDDSFEPALREPRLLCERDKANRTLLGKAVQRNQGVVARALLAARADPSAPGQNGWSPLHYLAADGRDVELALLLVSAKADPNALTLDGMPALFYAINAGHEDMRDALIKAGAYRDTIARTARRNGGPCIGD
eukprot:TRINITY_DN72230_c0_g1_i1.p1 TRINITY_DN72230_c0_g1~~TRINITY_DN72230_c0_g1_i1.p1  ORF type:complete len:214 (+),score=7.85 TRINITY_DN72230_c0_g1_i1:156-797(+)